MGQDMLYSSGTTGKPKGIKLPLKNIPIEQSEDLMALLLDYMELIKILYIFHLPPFITPPP